MGEDDRFKLVRVFPQIRDVGYHHIDPGHVSFRKHQPGVNDQHMMVVFDHHHIETYFPQPSQWNNLEHFVSFFVVS
jgi:hypothetical protein